MGTPYAWLEKALATIHRADWYRSLRPIEGKPGPVVQRDGRAVINFASNDYLGLAADPRLAAAAIAAIHDYGTGSTGSRLLSGHRPLHRQLEAAIATLKQTDDALVFSSGYLANLGTITALVGQRDLIMADQYNHSSLKQGARLSGATVIDYGHNDTAALQHHLNHHRQHHRRCLILTDSVFSMDGDICPLPALLDLAATYDSMVMIDEAHGTGVLGPRGAGVVDHFGCTGAPLIQMGTLSKALGSLGGYVAGSASLIDFLRNRAASWIYTTGLTPADTAAALAALDIVAAEPERRQQLWRNVDYLKQRLGQQVVDGPEAGVGMQLLPSDSPILCLTVPDAATAVALAAELQTHGCYVSAVRPPTAPTSRLRLTVMASHALPQLEHLVQALSHCWLQH
ncbi:Putative 8-amino-7-oxononanoate synthase [Halomicronema hongdechloris C2206]|uniref:8-amino-7-ketopelargonate synthase n=1 Tax=Halomicronema hongdechloris C2206 TaxID=1641165 RepID=A0A1Z3HUF1_9CYAN|nr:8-amino-7-oxononanoate synthase [Halomicronema hongdechloris]ASC73757.1 Putative 8-amino-7-oxononanoate synthase [Halomicronema hongdechloris C2206]